MKKIINHKLYLFVWVMLFLAGCKKDDVINKPGGNPGPVPASNIFRFTLETLPGEINAVGGLYAIINVINEQNQPVLINKKLTLQHNGKYLSDSLTLPNGNYKISKFFIINGDSIVRFVTPIANSAKAGLVQKPLTISFSLPKTNVSLIPVEVARVAIGDQPESFGYPTGSFDNPGNGDPTPDPFIKIIIHPLIRIGDVVYDSIPVSFSTTIWDAAGQMTTTHGSLNPGKNEVSLPRSAVKYRFKVSKWGTIDEMTLLKKDVQEGTVYSLGGSRAAKKLKSVLTYKLVDGVYKPETRNVFEYDGSGKLIQILYYLRRADNSPYLDRTDKFAYNGIGKVEKINRYDERNVLMGENSFSYDHGGKIAYMVQNEGGAQTIATVEYSPFPGGTGITGNYYLNIKYSYSQHYYTMNYNMTFQGGNNIRDVATTSHHNSEMGSYQYDFNINPYRHMNWPNIFLSHSSMHNVIVEQKSYKEQFPTVVPYGFVFKYDADGYPEEVIKSYKSYTTGQYLYKIKTVYNY